MKHSLYLLSMAALLTACYSAPTDEMAPDESLQQASTKQFTFTIKGDFTNPEFATGNDEGIPLGNGTDSDNSSKAQTRAYMQADGVEMTDLWVIDYKDGEIVQMQHQQPTDTDWGAPTMTLTLGTHHVLFLASRGTEPVYADGKVTWTKPLDTFYTDYEVVVVKTSNGNRAVTLDRVATKMQLYVNDAIAPGTTSISFTPTVWYNGWDMISGTPIAATDYRVSWSMPSSTIGVAGINFTAWALSAKDEWHTDVLVQSHTASGTNAEVTIPDVPLKANRATIYRGNLYTTSSSSSVSLNSTWQQQYEGVY